MRQERRNMEIGWILGGFFIFMTLLFIVIAAFFPEWIGITGKKARENMREHQGDFKDDSKIEKKDLDQA